VRGADTGKRELLCSEMSARCEVTEEEDVLCDMWVLPHSFHKNSWNNFHSRENLSVAHTDTKEETDVTG
jgi:hypothetical protein